MGPRSGTVWHGRPADDAPTCQMGAKPISVRPSHSGHKFLAFSFQRKAISNYLNSDPARLSNLWLPLFPQDAPSKVPGKRDAVD